MCREILGTLMNFKFSNIKAQMKVSLRRKVSISVMVIITVFTAMSAIAIYSYAKALLLKNIESEIASVSRTQSHEATQILSEGRRVIEAIATHPNIMNYFSQGERNIQDEDILRDLAVFNLDDHYSAIYILDLEGTTLVSTEPSFVGKNYKFRNYFEKSLQGEQGVDVGIGMTSGEMGYYSFSPIWSVAGDILGVAVAKMRPDAVHNSLHKAQSSNKTNIMFVDQYGVVLFASDPTKILHSLGTLKLSPSEENIKNNRFSGIDIPALGYDALQVVLSDIYDVRVLRIFDKYDGEREILSISKVGEFPFYLVTEQDENFYQGQIIKMIMLMVVLFLAGGAASVVSIRMILKQVFLPLEKLNETVHHITQGDYNHKVHIHTGDELEEFGEGFNKMIETLKRTKRNIDRKILSQTHGLLDQKKDLELKQVVMKGLVHEMEVEREKNRGLVKDLQKFLLAIENASDHVVITDPDGVVVYANPAVEKITGYKVDDILGQKAGTSSNWGGLMGDKFYKQLWKTLKKDKKIFSGELHNKKKGGTEYDVLAHISPVLDDKGEITFFVAIERDVTKEKQIDKAKTEFVSLASHQLRTPLSSINWYTEMLLAGDVGELNKEQKEYLGLVYEGNQRMVALVNSLLNVSRVDLGTFAVEPEDVDLSIMADSVLGELVPDTTTKKLKIVRKYDKKLPLFKANSKLIRIVLQNLLTNAVKYTPEKGTITVTIEKSGTKNLLIEVKDTGYGIPEEQHNKIFTKLFRADNVRVKDSEGNGLGLYLVKAIVEEAKGKISFKSQENKGATFSIILPLKGMKKKEGARTIS